ncbi:MAG: IPT/TIG domain-containing protein [Treponema sp.]|nr:IPT/TIG domain-containing protein [Treponema sp.]
MNVFRQRSPVNRIRPERAALLLVLAPCLFFPVSCKKKSPLIRSISPKIGMMGEALTIEGENFGEERDESYVTIAGISPTNSSYLSWQENNILVKIPEFGESGLVYVHVGGRKSNGALFSNRATLPRPVQGTDPGFGPRISSINPPAGAVGSLITITGNNFGSSRERSAVFFSWNAESLPSAPVDAQAPGFTEVFETDFGYELWSEREIRVRIPDGAVSGNLEVRTIRGSSRPYFFEVTGKPGTKTFRDKRSYTITYSVHIKVNEASGQNILYLWVPQPVSSASQRNIELLSRDMEPFVENYRGTSIFQLNNLSAKNDAEINISYQVGVFAVETSVRPQSIKQEEDSPVHSIYTQAGPLIPSDDQRIKTQSAAIISRERNPYIKAQRIYEWLTGEDNFRFFLQRDAAAAPVGWDGIAGEPGENAAGQAGGALEALETKRADSYMAALLYCALLRAAGVPCIPVSGILVNRNRQAAPHYWAEFWIDGFGWIPVDPALGAGAVSDNFSLRSDRASFYFGSLDSQRIAFSRGMTNLSRMDPRGQAVTRIRSYALQNLWEEVVGGLESYSSLWGDIIVTGMYVQ